MTPQRHGTCGPGRCGSWSYGYDAAGNLTSQRDGRNQWLYFEYDALNRLVAKRQDSANGTLLAEYQFDATGQKGLLSRSKAYTAEGVVEISNVTYDVRGRLTQQNWIVPGTGGGTFGLDHSYNAADHPATLRYPGGTAGQQGELVTTGYNALGQLNSVSGSGVSYVSSTTYNARGQVTEQRLDTGSNGLTRQYVYDQNTMRLTTLRAGVASPYARRSGVQNLSYTYDAVGNVTSIVDGVNSSQRQCFGYDALDRLTNAFTGNSDCTAYTTGGTGPYNHTYVYDAIGNLTSYAGNTYTYGDSSHKHAVTSAYGNTYGYDGNGNQTTRTIAGTTYTFVFDYENRLTEVKQGSTTLATFLYDADGNRVKGTVSGTTTVYIAGIYERQGAAYTSYYEGGGLRRSGYTTNNGVFYMLSDHLKSTSALVARNGVLNVKYFYYPYGARRGVPFNTITAKHFTGQYHETALPGGEGLSYYGARWYDPKLGRFLSADTIVPNASNPQDLNRFAYVRNNPLRYVDPSGHILCDGATSCAQGGSAQPGSGAAKKPPAPPPPPNPNPNTYQKTYGNDVKPSRLPSITQEPQYQTVRVAMANMVWFEEGSDGGSDQSMTAAAYVVRNRAEGNLDRILSLLVPNGEFQGYQGAFRPHAVSGAMWMKILEIVDSVLIGTVQDPTGGAEYFGNVFDETEALDYHVALAHWVSTHNPAYSGLDFNDESDRQLLLYYAGYGEIARLDHKVFVFNAMEPIKLTPGGRVIYPPLQLTPSVNWTFASK